MTVSNEEPHALTHANPVCGATHLNQTDRFGATHVEWTGSPSCAVASMFEPLADTPVVSTAGCSKSSFGGAAAAAGEATHTATVATANKSLPLRTAPASPTTARAPTPWQGS